jgi:ATP-dependent DNA ligase
LLSSAGQTPKARGRISVRCCSGYYTDDGKLVYAGRVGTGMRVKVLADLQRRLDSLARKTSSLSVPPPLSTRFGSPLVLSRVHSVEPRLVCEITYLTWTADNLLPMRPNGRSAGHRAPWRGRSMFSALAVVKWMIAFAARSSIASAT